MSQYLFRVCCAFINLLVLAVCVPPAGGADLQHQRITKEYKYQLTTALRAFSIWLSVRSLPSVTELVGSKEILIRKVTEY